MRYAIVSAGIGGGLSGKRSIYGPKLELTQEAYIIFKKFTDVVDSVF